MSKKRPKDDYHKFHCDNTNHAVNKKLRKSIESKSKVVRVLYLPDLHQGHKFAMCLPEFHLSRFSTVPRTVREYRLQAFMYNTIFKSLRHDVEQYGLYHVICIMGDLIEGKGKKNSGVELIRPKLTDQIDMAVMIIAEIKKFCVPDVQIYMCCGTGYHITADGENMEEIAAREIGGYYQDVINVELGGVMHNLKHKIGSTSSPVSVPPLRRETIWNRLWAEKGIQEAKCLVRAHTHSYFLIQDSQKTALTLPALQGYTEYGARECSRVVDFGYVREEVYGGEIYKIEPRIFNVPDVNRVFKGGRGNHQ